MTDADELKRRTRVLGNALADALGDTDDDSFDASKALTVLGMCVTAIMLSLPRERRAATVDRFVATLLKSLSHDEGKETRH